MEITQLTTTALLNDCTFRNVPIFSKVKVRSYQNGACKTSNVKVCRYADGSVVLDDGIQRFVQRPLYHPERRIAQTICPGKKTRFSVFRFLKGLLIY